MTSDLKVWLNQYVMDAILSPAGAKIVGLLSVLGNGFVWAVDNPNLIAAMSGIVVTWLVYIGSEKKRKLEMKVLQMHLDKDKRERKSNSDENE